MSQTVKDSIIIENNETIQKAIKEDKEELKEEIKAIEETTDATEEVKEEEEETEEEYEFKCEQCSTVQGLNNCENCDKENICEECYGQGGDYGPNEIWVCNECLPICLKCKSKLYTVYDTCCGNGRSDISEEEDDRFVLCEECTTLVDCHKDNIHILYKGESNNISEELVLCTMCFQGMEDDLIQQDYKCDEWEEDEEETEEETEEEVKEKTEEETEEEVKEKTEEVKKEAKEIIKEAKEIIKEAKEEIKEAKEVIKEAKEEIREAKEEIKEAKEEIKEAKEEIKEEEEEVMEVVIDRKSYFTANGKIYENVNDEVGKEVGMYFKGKPLMKMESMHSKRSWEERMY